MKTHKNLYSQVCSFDNLLLAARKAAKGKRSKPSTARFLFELAREIPRLQRELLDQTYQPGGYTRFTVRDTKPRVISAAPFRDRVVHHALCNVIEPIFDKTFIHDSYACRRGKGTHAAVDRYQAFCRKNRYVLKGDIVRYFPSMDHEILMAAVAKRIACERTLGLIRKVLGSMRSEDGLYFSGDDLFTPFERPHGIPIGNLTSQFFANVHLTGFDHWVKETLERRFYVRYVDDFVIFGDDKPALWDALAACRERLGAIRLRLHPRKSRVYRVSDGIDFLGYRVFPTHRLLRKSNVRHARRRLRKLQAGYREGTITLDDVRQSVMSWIAHASHADAYRVRGRVLRDAVFAGKG